MTMLVVMIVPRNDKCSNTTDIFGYADPITEAECSSCASDGVAMASDGNVGAELQIEIARCQVDKHKALWTAPANKTDKTGVDPDKLAELTCDCSGVKVALT